MRALELRVTEGPDSLVLVERDDPTSDDAVVIDVRAAGVSFPDLLLTHGRYQVKPSLPATPGLEVAGIVRAAPFGSGLEAGARVWAALEGGGFADVVMTSRDRVFSLDDALGFVEGAALPVNYLTAVFALQRRGAVQAGETLLVLGAGGGLGSALVSVGHHLGARVIAVVSTEAKGETARAAGADQIVVGGDWRERVLTATSGRGADLTADPVGGAATIEAVRATAPEGRVLVLGFASGEIPAVQTNRLLLRNVSLIGVGLGALISSLPELLMSTADALAMLVQGGLRPIVGATFPLEKASEALHFLEQRKARGKVVLTVAGTTA
jgi:NADPH2:quinone reductase